MDAQQPDRPSSAQHPTEPVDMVTGPHDERSPRGARRFLAGRTALAGLVVAGAAVGAVGVALADDAGSLVPSLVASPVSSTPSPSASPEERDGDRRDGRMGGRHGGLAFGGGRALHGELVVPKPGGGYQTMVVQGGEVTAVSASSITVKSEDGFSQTYAVTADTLVNAARDGIDTVKKGVTARVVAVRSGDTLTAVHVSDQTLREGFRDRFGPGHKDGRGRGDHPSPSPSATASGASA